MVGTLMDNGFKATGSHSTALIAPLTRISIDWQELFAIYIACFLWGPH